MSDLANQTVSAYKDRAAQRGCPHCGAGPERYWAWTAQGVLLCLACCECGNPIRGHDATDEQMIEMLEADARKRNKRRGGV